MKMVFTRFLAVMLSLSCIAYSPARLQTGKSPASVTHPSQPDLRLVALALPGLAEAYPWRRPAPPSFEQLRRMVPSPGASKSERRVLSMGIWKPAILLITVVLSVLAPAIHAQSPVDLEFARLGTQALFDTAPPTSPGAKVETSEDILRRELPGFAFSNLGAFSEREAANITTAVAAIRAFASNGKGLAADGIRHFLNDPSSQIIFFKIPIGQMLKDSGKANSSQFHPEGISFLKPFSPNADGQKMLIGLDPVVFENGVPRVLTVIAKEVVGRAAVARKEGVQMFDFHAFEAAAYDAALDCVQWIVSSKNSRWVNLPADVTKQIRKYGVPHLEWWSNYSKGVNQSITPPEWPRGSASNSAHNQRSRRGSIHDGSAALPTAA